MSDIDKQLFRIFSSFIRDLAKTYPEIKNCLYRNYEDCLVDENKILSDHKKLEKFLSLIEKYEKYIIDKNSEFFDLEIELLEEISFKKLWEKNISGKTRETIWRYLQTFQIININLKSNKKLQEALNNIESDSISNIDKKTAKDLKKLKKLSTNVQKDIPNETVNEDFDNMFEGLLDGGIGEVAKEVAENMNIEEMFGNIDEQTNPMDIMNQMMNPEKMGSIFKNINSIMDKKMKSGELSEDKLKEEAQGMMGKMSENPLFSNMMKEMEPKVTNLKEKNTDSNNKINEELTREEKQKKLREKIKEKKNNR